MSSNTSSTNNTAGPAHGSQLYIDRLLILTASSGASDLHITAPSPPIFRIHDRLVIQNDLPPLDPAHVEEMFKQITNEQQRLEFEKELELDFAYSLPGVARFRVNAMQQRGSISLAFRLVPFKVPTIDELGLPAILKDLIMKPRGLILITGTAGSGKSTTMAAMINHLNENAERNVITIEDPIEFLFRNHKCVIRQRELGYDTRSIHTALVHALRHDPDVILVGEMRDLATISTAITAAETGHLVLGTLHTIDTVQAVDRVIDIFPAAQQQQMRSQFAQVIEAVIAQTLLPRIGGGLVAAHEIMVATPMIRQFIRENKAADILGNLEMSGTDGRQSMNQSLAALVKKNLITKEDALKISSDQGRLRELLDPGAKYRF